MGYLLFLIGVDYHDETSVRREEATREWLICLWMVADLVVPPADLVVAAPATTPSSISKTAPPPTTFLSTINAITVTGHVFLSRIDC